jgi:hypothetical protein
MRSITQKKADSRLDSKPPTSLPTCHRCGGLAPKRGRMSASVEGENGKVRRLYLCARCIASISSWHALARNAEAAELESQRQRFQTRRPAARMEAA